MNTKLIAIAAAAIILLGGGAFFLLNKNTSPSTTTNEVSASPATSENKSGSIFDLLTSGVSQQCTFEHVSEDGDSSKGTAYIATDKVRVDTTVSANNKTSSYNMIRNGDDNYIWGTDLETGIKMKLSLDEFKENDQASQYMGDINNTDYKCSPWIVDNSKFSPPTNVKFTDFSAMMDSMKGVSKPDSSACDSITDASAKAACVNALSDQ